MILDLTYGSKRTLYKLLWIREIFYIFLYIFFKIVLRQEGCLCMDQLVASGLQSHQFRRQRRWTSLGGVRPVSETIHDWPDYLRFQDYWYFQTFRLPPHFSVLGTLTKVGTLKNIGSARKFGKTWGIRKKTGFGRTFVVISPTFPEEIGSHVPRKLEHIFLRKSDHISRGNRPTCPQVIDFVVVVFLSTNIIWWWESSSLSASSLSSSSQSSSASAA